MMTSPAAVRRQKRMGPAPFASFEDLSDEVRSRLESPDDKNVATSVVRLPGIREDITPTTPSVTDRAPSPAYPFKGISIIGSAPKVTNMLNPKPPQQTCNIQAPTPRIDISRASSSSHHDSKDSSPERELFDPQDRHSAKLGLGFKEDGALDLRSSTEELDFQEIPERRKSKARPQSPYQEDVEYVRKDSQCSDIVLLSISGRTSRLSSIGSQGSGQSRLSNASHISILSGQSGLSRSSSPHKLNLETSFCGAKPPQKPNTKLDETGTKHEADDLEMVLLSRKHDPKEAIFAEGIEVEKPTSKNTLPKTDVVNKISDIKITVHKPTSETNESKLPKSRFVAESGVEYFYIPLKGPLPPDLETSRAPARTTGKQKLREVKSANYQTRNTKNTKTSELHDPTPRCKSATPTPSPSTVKKEEAKYIRIKLKPDRCYSDESPKGNELNKPDSLDLDTIQNTSNYIHENAKLERIRDYSSLEPERSSVPTNINPRKPKDTECNIESISPSPSVSRKSSFTSIFKSKEATLSPESPSAPCIRRKNTLTGIIKDVGDNLSIRSRSKSRDRDSHKSSLSTAPSSTESIDTKSKHKSVLSLFKSSKKDKIKSESETSSQETLPSIEGIGKLEFKFNDPKISKVYHENPLEAASIRIPLHSPTYYEDVSIHEWKTSSQDSQETVIEASNKNVHVEYVTKNEETCPKKLPYRDSHKSSLSTAPSSTESIDTKSKHKSVLSLFKSSKKDKIKSESETSSQETLPSIEGIGKLEFKFNDPKISKVYHENPLEAASIRIPLHSPTYYEDVSIHEWKTSSQDSQETVIEASNKNVHVESVTKNEETCPKKLPCKTTPVNASSRQSSTSSDNVVFSTKLGNDEDAVFTTRLPKQFPSEKKVLVTVELNGIIEKKHQAENPPQLKSLEEKKISRDNSIDRLAKQNPREECNNVDSVQEKSLVELEMNEWQEKRISQISVGASSTVSSTADEDRNSSESERDPETNNNRKDLDLKLCLDIPESERKAIFLQQDSFEDELPYIPTTLPLERSSAFPIVPIKQRSAFEMKTFPIERPRSTTPINPSCLEEYCEEVMGSFNVESVTSTIEKLKISLPRHDSFDKPSKLKSPRKKDSNTNWFEFAEKGISRQTQGDVPPPLPPKGMQKAWINFEDIPEKRKAPKRIQTIPSRGYIEVPESVLQDNVLYNYVNPEECKCECHELNSKDREKRNKESPEVTQEDELPLLGDESSNNEKNGHGRSGRLRFDVAVSDCTSIISDSSVDLSTSIDPPEGSFKEPNLRTPFTSDLGLSSNRSSIVSQEEHKSPQSPNAFPKT
nr:uncharacterized protein LOC111504776 [Leptinotarsa decemlineata]